MNIINQEVVIQRFKEEARVPTGFTINGCLMNDDGVISVFVRANEYLCDVDKEAIKHFMYSNKGWCGIVVSLQSGYLSYRFVDSFVYQLNNSYYSFLVNEKMSEISNGLNNQLNSIVDDYEVGFATRDNTRVRVILKEVDVYDELFVLESVSEYCNKQSINHRYSM